ncbi:MULTISPECIES: branched-chain amino acid ABC transporter permease [unclassified Arthrobacter]|uniref:branched-chain amino acid ABC transporter permease n=1 Tax=unclassified Arthrobacter TaxID=235627 RepID=UPI001E58645C|nr:MULTISPECIES: branched-chain amino acid ABC transporter permease [unclassified Arthrobacter]MCC9146527.1 branched-chain amino acid ABC transporter permease [Arthrobacter sp. zg-Y919]MDK1277757.1 branched-chain amino acid ABC transporter permease [Arthrobacter sp. zg.Y919]WIB02288.1 branched-chain amino acid ABC transporter permease [Arthrobacter sp. zg-Y919]
MTVARRYLFAAIAAAVLIGLTFVVPSFSSYQLATVCAYLCGIAGLTLLTGAGGQLSLGQAALMAAGAYSYALTANTMADAGTEGPLLLLLPLAAAVGGAAVLGLVIGLAAGRLHGPYLAGFTMALVVALPAVTSTFSSVLGGDQGLWITVEKRPTALRGMVSNEAWQAWLAVVCSVLVLTLLANLLHGRFGRELRAVRDNPVAAALAGINPARTKVTAFVISSAAAGMGGGLLAYTTQSASPGAYSLVFSLFLLMAAVVGGIGSLTGAVFGAVLLVALPHLISTATSRLQLSADLSQRLDGNLAVAIFGLVLVLVVLLAPQGIHGLLVRLRSRLRSRATPPRSESVPDSSFEPAPPSASTTTTRLSARHESEQLPATPKGQ